VQNVIISGDAAVKMRTKDTLRFKEKENSTVYGDKIFRETIKLLSLV
jgi:hypothetical protein